MSKVVMPKNSAMLEEIEAVLKIYYGENNWLSNDIYKARLKDMGLINTLFHIQKSSNNFLFWYDYLARHP